MESTGATQQVEVGDPAKSDLPKTWDEIRTSIIDPEGVFKYI